MNPLPHGKNMGYFFTPLAPGRLLGQVDGNAEMVDQDKGDSRLKRSTKGYIAFFCFHDIDDVAVSRKDDNKADKSSIHKVIDRILR
jgi:hypothetical protein